MVTRIRVRLNGDWNEAREALDEKKLRDAIGRAHLAEAHRIRGQIVEGVIKQAPAGQPFKPLSPLTIAVRRMLGFTGTKALIRTGTLVNSVTVKRVVTRKHATAFVVGVLRSARRRGAGGRFAKGKSPYNVARIQEEGRTFVVRVTPKMRAFLMAAFRHAPAGGKKGTGAFKRGIIVIKIPARPFISPVIEAARRDREGMRRRMAATIAVSTLGRYGRP